MGRAVQSLKISKTNSQVAVLLLKRVGRDRELAEAALIRDYLHRLCDLLLVHALRSGDGSGVLDAARIAIGVERERDEGLRLCGQRSVAACVPGDRSDVVRELCVVATKRRQERRLGVFVSEQSCERLCCIVCGDDWMGANEFQLGFRCVRPGSGSECEHDECVPEQRDVDKELRFLQAASTSSTTHRRRIELMRVFFPVGLAMN